jgi:hypothetical protein
VEDKDEVKWTWGPLVIPYHVSISTMSPLSSTKVVCAGPVTCPERDGWRTAAKHREVIAKRDARD